MTALTEIPASRYARGLESAQQSISALRSTAVPAGAYITALHLVHCRDEEGVDALASQWGTAARWDENGHYTASLLAGDAGDGYRDQAVTRAVYIPAGTLSPQAAGPARSAA